jgi:hypothetical protein
LYQGLLNCQRQMTTGLSFSLPYTDITGSYKKGPTNAHTYYSQHFINTVLLQHVSALKSRLQAVRLIHFTARSTKCVADVEFLHFTFC